jgi:hypothetical protein
MWIPIFGSDLANLASSGDVQVPSDYKLRNHRKVTGRSMSENPTWGFRRAKSDDDYNPPLKQKTEPRRRDPVPLPSWTFDDPPQTAFKYGSPAFPKAPHKPAPDHPPISVAEHLKLLAAAPRRLPQPEPPTRPVASFARPPPPQTAPGILFGGELNLAADPQKVEAGRPTVKSPGRANRRQKKTTTKTESTGGPPGNEAV